MDIILLEFMHFCSYLWIFASYFGLPDVNISIVLYNTTVTMQYVHDKGMSRSTIKMIEIEIGQLFNIYAEYTPAQMDRITIYTPETCQREVIIMIIAFYFWNE